MNVLLINPPNCGRSIPEERYGILSLKQIFRGEPLALEELAGNLTEHDVRIVDLKADSDCLDDALSDFSPDVAGITGVTCEANTMLTLAAKLKSHGVPIVVIGGVHASNDPEFFNHPEVDFIVVGLGKKVFADLLSMLEKYGDVPVLSGLLKTNPGFALPRLEWCNTGIDLVDDKPPAYHLVQSYRHHYVLEKLNINMGFVASAFGCPHRCSFCCIKGQTGGAYLSKSIDAVLRDIRLLGDIPVIRLVDANTFGDTRRAKALGQALMAADLQKQYLADIRSDTVVRHPEMVRLWQQAGLRAVIIGFEEISDAGLSAMNKANKAAINIEAIALLKEMGITIVGDFIISPDYDEGDFARLGEYLSQNKVDLPMITVMTPLPGTELYRREKNRIVNDDLDYYTLTNAVTRTRLEEKRFYTLYAELLTSSHKNARI